MSRANRSRELFLDAQSRDPAERRQFVTDASGDDHALRDEVLSLLDAASESDAYFERLSVEASRLPTGDEPTILPADKVIGQWRLLKLIGRGGMGSVYLADRADGQFEKRVALKILPIGLADERARARFLLERQILARLVHDNIARLLDGGVTDDGTPYFVMDYVEGVPIDRYCEREGLGIAARLALVLELTRGVQYAHRNLVIHRDLKPGNLLVDDAGHVRLLDFGVAKMLEPDSGQAALTQVAWRPMTPAFASPEMLRGDAVDVTTDVYSIGVLIYLLVTGRLPLTYGDLSIADMHAHAATTVPPPVSHYNREASRDLDAIVARALAKEPAERYASAESLANDIGNLLAGLPVVARSPSPWYRARLFVRRHRVAVSFAVLALLSITTIAGLAVHSAIVSERQSRTIALALERAEQTRDFLTGIFDSAEPNQDSAELTAREILDAGMRRITTELAGQPELQTDLLKTMAEVYAALGLASEWRETLAQERTLRRQSQGEENAEYTDVLLRLSEAEDLNGNYERSLELAEEALALNRRLGNRAGEAAARIRVARTHHLQGDHDRAEAGYREGLAIYRTELGEGSWPVAEARMFLATLLNHRQRHKEAYELLRDAWAVYSTLDDHSSPRTDLPLALANTLQNLDRVDEAVAILEDTLAANDQWFGPDNMYNMYVTNSLGKVEMDRGNVEIAGEHFREAIRLLGIHTPGSPNLGFAKAYLGESHMLAGDFAGALPLFRDAYDIFRERLPEHWYLAVVRWRLGRCMVESGEYATAEPHILESIDALEAQWGREHDATREAYTAAADLYEAWGRPERAASYRR